jgi:hypothetical protein
VSPLRKLFLVIGVGLIVLSIVIAAVTERPIPSLERISHALAFRNVIGPPGPGDWDTISATLEINVEYPPVVSDDQSFTVTLKVSVRDAGLLPSGPVTSGPRRHHDGVALPPESRDGMPGSAPMSGGATNLTDADAKSMVNQQLVRDVAFSLSLSGTDVQPSGPVHVGEQRKALWSVRTKGAGV